MKGHTSHRKRAEPGKSSDAGMMNPNEIQVKEANASGNQFEPLQTSIMLIQHIKRRTNVEQEVVTNLS